MMDLREFCNTTSYVPGHGGNEAFSGTGHLCPQEERLGPEVSRALAAAIAATTDSTRNSLRPNFVSRLRLLFGPWLIGASFRQRRAGSGLCTTKWSLDCAHSGKSLQETNEIAKLI